MNCDAEMMALLQEVANGDSDALNAVTLACTYFHCFDDLVDKDLPPTARNFVRCNNLLLRLTVSKFFRDNQASLAPILLLVGDDYAASNEGFPEVKSCGNQFLRAVALITGGEDHLAMMTKKLYEISIKNG